MCAERAADNPSDWANRPAQRRSRRVAFSSEVWIGQDGIFTRTDARFGDVSASGAFLHLRDSYSLGSVLSLKYRLPGEADDPESIFLSLTPNP